MKIFVLMILMLLLAGCSNGQKILYCDENKTIPRIKLCSFDDYKCELHCVDNENRTLYMNIETNINPSGGLLSCNYATVLDFDNEVYDCKVYCPEPKFVDYNCEEVK